MSAAQARRAASRAAAVALAVLLGAASMMLGSGAASAQTAPRELTCTIGNLGAPVALTEGDRVQLVLVVPLLGEVTVGPEQTAMPGMTMIAQPVSGLVASLLGVVTGTLCRAAVQVQTVVTSALPLPPLPSILPTTILPPLLPTQSITVPIPGVGVTVAQPGTSSGAPAAPGDSTGPGQPGTSTPPPPLVSPGAGNGVPGFRFDPGALPTYDFSRTPFGVGSRFGALAAPAFRFGQQVPGYAPQFGILGADSGKSDVANAGRVQALPFGGSDVVALPVLLAVLMLSAVAGALVRTWVLRRAV